MSVSSLADNEKTVGTIGDAMNTSGVAIVADVIAAIGRTENMNIILQVNAIFFPEQQGRKVYEKTIDRNYIDSQKWMCTLKLAVDVDSPKYRFDCNHKLMSADIRQLSNISPKQQIHEAIQAYIIEERYLPQHAF